MKYLFQQLQNLCKDTEVEDLGAGYQPGAMIQKFPRGTQITVGGKIIDIVPDFFIAGNYFVTLDDDISKFTVYMIKEVSQNLNLDLQLGQKIICSGRVVNYNASDSLYVMISALKVLEESN